MSNGQRATRRVAVVGGGVTGLSAALSLLEARPSWRVEVLESSDRLGGVIQTQHRDGFTLELGPDSLLRRVPWGVGLCQRLGIEDQLVGTQPAARGVYTVHRGRTTRMPDGLALMAPERVWPIVRTPILSLSGKLRMASERFLPPRRDGADESLAAFARRRFGEEAFARIVQPLAGGIYMGDPERLSLRACFPQFAAMEAEHGSLIKATRAARHKRPSPADGHPPSVFVAPAAGLGTMIDALRRALSHAVIHLSRRVTAIEPTACGWRLTAEDVATARTATEGYDAIVLAAPAGPVAELLRPVDARAGDLLAGVAYSGCAIVQLAYRRADVPHPLDASGVVVPHVEGRPLQACSFTSVKYAGRAPDGTVLLRAFFGGALRAELVSLQEEALVRLARDEIAALLGVSTAPLLQSVTRWRESMPQYELGHTERIDELDARVEPLVGLELAGAAYRGVGIPHCIRSGEQAAQRIVTTLDQAPGAAVA